MKRTPLNFGEIRLSETSPIEFWRNQAEGNVAHNIFLGSQGEAWGNKSYTNVGAVRPRETNCNTRAGGAWVGGAFYTCAPIHVPLGGGKYNNKLCY